MMRRGREVEAGWFYFLQTIFNTPSKRAIPFPFQITKISFCNGIRSICNVKHNSLKFQHYKRNKKWFDHIRELHQPPFTLMLI